MEQEQRVTTHPILSIGRKEFVRFYWKDQQLTARKGEVISSALFAAGIQVFGSHHRDGSAMGIFCANGQCSQCTVLANGIPVKACITEISENMIVAPCNGIPKLPAVQDTDQALHFKPTPVLRTQVAIIGGGPAGLKAAVELANLNIRSILIDDKANLGGKLVLQTHTFFGSVDDCYAGTRGIDIALRLENEARARNEITIMTSTQAVGVFSDNKIGVVKGNEYYLIEPDALLIATGAREKALAFSGCDLPGVYGAGAFQTLVNRDLVRAGSRIFIVGGGNVGIIAAYHALQAGIEVAGLIEALPKVSGYKVHKDKIQRLGVPILLSHTILSANPNKDRTGVTSATIAEVDSNFQRIPGTEKEIACDTILVAAGLSSCDEFYRQAKAFGLKAYLAGDAGEIAEASAAMFSGKIAGLTIAKDLGASVTIPTEYIDKMEVLKSKPGNLVDRARFQKDLDSLNVYPVFHCYEEIPCNPCVSACVKGFIRLKGETGTIMDLPYFEGDRCSGCVKCVAICPGLAITLVDKRKAPEGKTFVFIPFEMIPKFRIGDRVQALDDEGGPVEETEVVDIVDRKWQDKTLLIKVLATHANAAKIAGIRYQRPEKGIPTQYREEDPGERVICRCEKVKDKEIRQMIRSGITDMNALKILRCTMGACGGKTCAQLVQRIFKEEGVDLAKVTPPVMRPLNAEVALGTFANLHIESEPNYESDI